ncbi:hypothetical protein Taro_031393 [Colocasia esculenta]|uniref:DhaL domain-containing protein n=1 Tax=Colocasia esculenta TaxID=4460 RepID=A0A843VIR2_COLES|nr:hypothetical protein [Colocasia esculenta]
MKEVGESSQKAPPKQKAADQNLPREQRKESHHSLTAPLDKLNSPKTKIPPRLLIPHTSFTIQKTKTTLKENHVILQDVFRLLECVMKLLSWLLYPLNDAAETISELGASIGRVMGGTSGILYTLFCKAAYAKLKGFSSPPTAKEWADALEASIAAISKYGGATTGYRTMLDALIPAATVLKEKLDAGLDPVDAFIISSEAAISGAESTRHMQPQTGRSSYVSGDVIATVPDPGAVAAAAWYQAAAFAIKNKS